MWAAKLPSEGANIYDACRSMCRIMEELGIAVDGGKDSLSMAAQVDDKIIKAPGALVVSTYAQCTDIEATVTPDLKCPNGQGQVSIQLKYFHEMIIVVIINCCNFCVNL